MLSSGIPIPKSYKNLVQFVVNADLHRYFTKDEIDISRLQKLIGELDKWQIQLSNEASFSLAASERIFWEIQKLEHMTNPLNHINKLTEILSSLQKVNIKLDIWKSQNLYFPMIKGYIKGDWVFASKEIEEAYVRLGKMLNIEFNRQAVEA